VSDPPAGRRTPDELVELVLGAPRAFTREDVADAAGTDVEAARALWRGMGFPDVGEVRAFTSQDVEGLRTVVDLVSEGVLDEAAAVDVARALGQTGSRLAEWQVGTFARRLVERGTVDVTDGAAGRTDALYDEVERCCRAGAPRGALVAPPPGCGRGAGAGRGGGHRRPRRRDHGAAHGGVRRPRGLHPADAAAHRGRAGGLVERFEAVSADVVAMTGARLVKTLGDEVLFVAESPGQAVETALRLHAAHADDDEVPELRIGLATGEVVSRMGDVFGTTVNRAARLTSLASAGATWADRPTVDAVRAPDGHRLERLVVSARAVGPRGLRGLGVTVPSDITGADQD
jgi:adenylate cyclase